MLPANGERGNTGSFINWTDHAGGKEISRFDVVQCDVAGHLPYGISDGEYRIDLIELISLEIELLSHARDVCIIEVGPV